MDTEYYLTCFRSLNTNKSGGRIAPHKPILLISLMDLYESGLLIGSKIELDETLQRTFGDNWARYVGDSDIFRPHIATPFWHMRNEPFWELVSKSGISENEISSPYSVNVLKSNFYAQLDQDLAKLMQNPFFRDSAMETLLDTYQLK